jgi:hypothetical protein
VESDKVAVVNQVSLNEKCYQHVPFKTVMDIWSNIEGEIGTNLSCITVKVNFHGDITVTGAT